MKKWLLNSSLLGLMLLALLTNLSARSWDDIVASKELRIATRVREGVMSKEQNSGFHYDLARAFAKKNGLELKLVVKSSLTDYLTASIFTEADIIVDNLTTNAERADKMSFSEIIPIKQILVTMAGHIPLRRIPQLTDETIVVAKDSSYYIEVQKREKENSAVFKYAFSASTADQLTDLAAGKGTVTILDSNLAALSLTDGKYQLHGAISPKQSIAWGVEKGQSKTAEKIASFITEVKNNGTFSKTWDKYIEGISYEDYLKLAQ